MPDFFTLEFWRSLFDDFIQWFLDFPVWILHTILDAIASVFESINPPAFVAAGLDQVLGPTAPYIGFFLARSGFAEALALLGVGLAFRFTRKLLTLGQW
jgi:hypothetical protein